MVKVGEATWVLAWAGAMLVACGGSEPPSSSGTDGGDVVSGDVSFAPPSGTFQGAVEVRLATAVSGAEIRYTTDGTAPTASSPLYDGTALTLTATTQLRAQVFSGTAPAGTGATGLYVVRSFDFSGDLPLVVLDAYGGGAPPEQSRDFYDAAFLLFAPNGGAASLSTPPALATRAGFHVRGQSSASFDKKPYRVEFWDESNEDRDLSVLGLPAEADWALIGPRADETLIRHAYAYDLAHDMGLQAPRYRFVELYLNTQDRALDEEDYQGVYMLVETIKNAKNRLDLKQLEEDDVAPEQLSGGYIFKFEYAAAEEPTLPCMGAQATCWNHLEVYDPAPLAQPQREWLRGHIQAFHDALHGSTVADPASGYPAYIDVPSFVDMFILSELTKNVDAYVRSMYFYKDRDQPIFAGPVWDYNLSMGAGFDFGGINNLETAGWMYPQRTDGVSDWFPVLAAEPSFDGRVRARWAELRGGLFSDEQMSARVDVISAPLVAGASRNFALWGQPGSSSQSTTMGGGFGGGVSGGGGPLSIFTGPDAPTWEGQLQAMKDWMVARAAWLDTQWR